MRVEDGFQPAPYVEPNAYESDAVLPLLLKRILPQDVYDPVVADCIRLAEIIPTEIRPLGALVAPPKLVQYNQWGQRIDELQTSEGWRALKAVHQREGIPGIFYERRFGEYSRIYGFAKVLLLLGDSHTILCPLSMTDGCARTLELFGSPEMKRDILPRLISRDPSIAFTSGQWMTERPGGSDISQTETIAHWLGKSNSIGPMYNLDGFKWFSSATDSQVSIALARIGSLEEGSRGLSLFLVPLRKPLFLPGGNGQTTTMEVAPPSSISNGIRVHRLKNKFGTHSLPTAELSLEGTEAYLVGKPNQGVKTITPVLNITRMYSAISSIGALRKALAIATSYSEVRAINGGKQLLKDNALHVEQLAKINLTYRALVHLAFGVIGLMGKIECNKGSNEDAKRLRMLTAVVKAFSAELAIPAMEEAMCALGGAGYMEENDIGRLIRDAMVERIWEGTTVVLSLELSRATQDTSMLSSFSSWASDIFSSCPKSIRSTLGHVHSVLQDAVLLINTTYAPPVTQLVHRPALMLVGYVASSLYLLEHAIWSLSSEQPSAEFDMRVLRRWVEEGKLMETVDEVKRAGKIDAKGRSGENVDLVFSKVQATSEKELRARYKL